jgi:alpha-amylase/alpha-mannosidase (GH57 family)
MQRLGALSLAVGQIQLTSELTRESKILVFAVFHLGGWDFHCCIQPFTGRRTYSPMKEALFQALKQGSAAQTILAMNRHFGDQSFSLRDLFAEERHKIMRLLSQGTLTRLDQLYTQVYRDNYGVLIAFHQDELEVPQELQVAAEIAISHRAMTALQALERETSDFPPTNPQLCASHLAELEAIAAEAEHLRCSLKPPQIKQTLERLILRALWHLLYSFNPATAEADMQWMERLLTLSDQLHLPLALDRAQEVYFKGLHRQVLPQLSLWQVTDEPSNRAHKPSWSLPQIRQFLKLGQRLAIDVQVWLEQC